MFKRISRGTRLTAIVLMALSVLTPVTVAEASGTITKQITVLGPDGNPYAGAQVALAYSDFSTGTDVGAFTSPLVTTDSSGVATLTFSDAISSGQLAVQPPASDTRTAVFFDYSIEYANNSPATVTLSAAALAIAPLKWNGEAAMIGGGISNGYKSYVQLMRTGAVGVAIPSAAVENICTNFYLQAADLSPDNFRRTFATKIIGSGNTREVKLYSDFGTCQNEVPKVDGVYQTKLNKGNVNGFLKTNGGGSLTIPNGKGYSVQFEGVNSDGSPNYGASYGFAYVQSDGSFTAAVDTSTAGKYHLSFGGFGDPNYPVFSAGFFYVTNDHKLSWSQDGSAASDAISQNFNLPNKNFSIAIVDSATSTNLRANLTIEKQVSNSTIFAPYASSPTSAANIGAYLTDGNYQISFGASNYWGDMSLTVANSEITVTSSTKKYTKSGNDFTFRTPTPNAKFRVVDSSNNVVRTGLGMCSNSCYDGSSDNTGLISMFIGDGNYPNVSVGTGGNLNLGPKKISVVVTNGIVSVTGATLNSSNEWVVVLPNSNFKYNVFSERTGARLIGYVQVYNANSSWSQTDYFGQAMYNSNGVGAAYLPDGNYIADVVPSSNTENDGLTTRKYRIAVSNSGATKSVSYNGVNVTAGSDGSFTFYPSPANLTLLVKDASGTTITSGQAEVWDTESNGSRSNQRWVNINSAGKVFANVRNGSSTVTIRPGISFTNAAMKTFTVTTTNDVPVVSGSTLSGSTWTVVAPTPNVRAVIKNATTNTPLSSAWVDVSRANDSWENTGWVYNLDINSSSNGNVRANLENGKYLFTVNPHDNAENVGLAAQTYRVAISDSGTTVALGSTVIDAVDGIFPLNPASSNFEIAVKKSNGTVFSNGWVNFCKADSYGNATTCNGIWLRSDGTMSRFLTDGNWQVVVVPASGQSDVSEKRYSVVVTGGVPAVTGLTIGGDGKWILNPGTPNLSGVYSTSSGPLVFNGSEGISLQIQKKDLNGNWQWQNGGQWSSSNGWAVNLNGAGRYRLVANPYNFDNLVQSFSADIWVDGSNKLSLSENGSYTDSLTAISLEMKTPNLKLKVVNPLNNDALVAGGWVEIQKVNGNNRTWVGNADINASNPGITGYSLSETGTYILKVNPPQGNLAIPGLAAKEYQLSVTALDSMTVTSGGVLVPVSEGRSILRLASANVKARILRTDGTAASPSNGRWVSVNLQKLNAWNGWDWTNNWANTDQNGNISFRVDAAGKYRLRIEPIGDSMASITYSNEFEVTSDQLSSFEKLFGNITLAPPSIRVSVATATDPNVILQNVSIEIRKDGNWFDWGNTSQSGTGGISLTSEGNYELTVRPTDNTTSTATKKAYKFVAAKNGDGNIVATPVTAEGASIDSNGIVKLLLGLPTLSGTVKDPTGTTLQKNAHVWAQNVSTGLDLWDASAWTNNLGTWAMSLPAGTYRIFADLPGSSEYGKTNPISNVIVASNGTVTVPAGYSANSFNIKLKAPTWTGTVKDPTGTISIPQGRVCLYVSNNWNCTNADSNGRWALSMNDSFTTFVNTNPILDISDDFGRAYPMRRIQGETAVGTALGGTTASNVELRLQTSNVQITVNTPGNTKVASNLWVVAERDGTGYLGSGTTDVNGLVKLNISEPSVAFKIRVDVNGNREISENFAPLMTTFSSDLITSGTDVNGIFKTAVELPLPNFKFVVREPTEAGTVVPNSWVELFSGNDGPWLGGASTDQNGYAHFKLELPSSGQVNNFTVTVNPSWNATTNFTKQAYAVAVTSSGAITVVNKTSISSVTTQISNGKTVYPLLQGVPSVTGVVVDPTNNGVANSWVVPTNASTNEYYWQQGVYSRNNGQLAMNLASGSYKLEANVPWGTSGLAKSAKCAVTVANGTISTGGDCVQSGTPNTVKLQLRLPNVKFTLKIGSTPIANANVSVGAGSWWTNAQSNEQGVVSLFIDAVAVREANPGRSGTIPLYFWIDPPYGSSIMARWSCASLENKPLCKDLPAVPATGDYVGSTDPTWVVQGVQPNTRLKIVAPGTSTDLANSWVSIYGMNSSGYKWWLGAGYSGSDGYVAINIETATPYSYGYNKLVVEVNSPWNERSKYATSLDTNNGVGYTFESMTAVTNFSPALPNLILKIKGANNYDNKYGWFNIAEVDSSNNFRNWVGGYGLNDFGDGAAYLPANKRYRLTAYPGSGRPGVQTSCILTTNSATPVAVSVVSCEGTNTLVSTLLTLRLAGGNVVGTVLGSDGRPLAGAAVYANQPGAATEATAIITVTDETGHYDLQLTAGMRWTITVFPVPTANEALPSKSSPAPLTAPGQGTTLTQDFSYVAS